MVKLAYAMTKRHDDIFLSSREFMWTIVALTSSISLSIVAFTGYDLYRKNNARKAAIHSEIQRKKEEITTAVSNAITHMMELRERTLLYCEASKEKMLELQIERVHKRYDFLKVSQPFLYSNTLFGDDYKKLIENFFDWEKSIKDYCQAGAPSKEEWEERLTKIEDTMRATPIKAILHRQKNFG